MEIRFIAPELRKLDQVATEVLAIVAYHQPMTRPEIEHIRGTALSQQTLDSLLELNLIAPKGRRETPGRPTLWGTTPEFLMHFGFDTIQDLPGLAELKGAGLLDSTLPPGFSMPNPDDAPALREDEDPLEDEPLGEDEDGPPGDD